MGFTIRRLANSVFLLILLMGIVEWRDLSSYKLVPCMANPQGHQNILTPTTQRQPTQQGTTNATKIDKRSELISVLEQFATDQFDPWQIVPRQVFTPYSRLLVSTSFVVVSRIDCLGVTGVILDSS